MVLLKTVFARLPEDHPYHFCNDMDRTGIVFDVAFNKAAGIWGKKPVVTVTRGSQSFGVLDLGDLSTRSLAMGSRNASNMVESSTDIRVVSKSKAETEIISERIFSSLMMMRTLLPELCGVHMVSSVSMSPAQQFEQDDTCYEVDITMQFSMQYKWEHATPVELLKGVKIGIDTALPK